MDGGTTRRGFAALLAAAPALAAPRAAVAAEDAMAAFKAAIRAKYDLKEQAFAAHDARRIVEHFYAPDVVSTGEGEGVAVGRSQLLPLYEDVVRHSLVRVVSFSTYVNGDAGWDWADFHVTPTDGREKPFTFRILFLWARENGAWWCKGDMYFKGSFRAGG